MDSEDQMILRDLPVDTRNYTIVDNITGKSIDQSNYTLTIDPEVIGKLNKLKKVNEEKIKQATLREKYNDDSLVSTFTPTDNAVFTPVYSDEYIDYHDFNNHKKQKVEEVQEVFEEQPIVPEVVTPTNSTGAEVFKSDTLLDRVVARDPNVRKAEEQAKLEAEEQEQKKAELDYITTADLSNDESSALFREDGGTVDNSLFTPEMTGLQQASEQIVKIDTKKLGQDLKRTKEQKKGTEKIKLDKMEIIAGKPFAWLAYIIFFIPLIFKRNNRFVRLHANEGLELNIMEMIGALLIAQFFLLPNIVPNFSGIISDISIIGAMVGAALIAVCIITIIPMMINAICGRQVQTPWLWKRRMIFVSSERTSD